MISAAVGARGDVDVNILRCPITKQSLTYRTASMLETKDGSYGYPIEEGIFLLTPDKAIDLAGGCVVPESVRQEKAIVRDFYDQFGWKLTESGKYHDTAAFIDQRPLSYAFTELCMKRVGGYLPPSGMYLLDAGSGAIPHRAYMDYHANYAWRICVDFSIEALHEARRKLGDRGIYVLGDITNLPFSDNAVDAVISNHVVYHVPADEQANAFRELWRVTRPGGRAVVVYSWKAAALPWWIEQFAIRILGLRRKKAALSQERESMPRLYFHQQSLNWFEKQRWPFKYAIRPFRVVSNEFLGSYLGNDRRSRILIRLLQGLQYAFPRLCGRYGQYPTIVISK